MDWEQIEKDLHLWYFKKAEPIGLKQIADWLKQRIEAEQSKQQQNNEAISYTTNVTAEIKPNYGK